MRSKGFFRWLYLWLGLWVFFGCGESKKDQSERDVAQARDIVLGRFQELDGFSIKKEEPIELLGRKALDIETGFLYQGQPHMARLCLIDNLALVVVLYYTAPLENQIYEKYFQVFEEVKKSLKTVITAGPMIVREEAENKVLISSDLQLEFRYPKHWTYTLDAVNHSLVLSGPRNESSWLSTINFSVIVK